MGYVAYVDPGVERFFFNSIMPIRITLSDSEVIEVDISLDEWNRAYQKAVRSDAMLEIEEPDGRILSINPHRVLFLETFPEARAEMAAG